MYFFSLNEHAVIKTNLKDALVNAANLCDCDFKLYLREQPLQMAKTLEAKRNLEAKSSATWYPLAREDLAQLVYQVSICLFYCIGFLLSLVGSIFLVSL